MKRFVKRTGGLVAVLVGAFTLAVVVRRDRTFDAPLPDIHASADPQVVERGKYLVTGPAHCGDCHGDVAAKEAIEAGATDVPMTGGQTFDLPVGKFHVPNITPDPETGIGRWGDAQIARAIRYGVRHDGRVMLPFMPYADMSDEDITAIVSYLRSRPAVRHEVPAHEPNALGSVLLAFAVEPKGPTQPVRATVPRGPTKEYGQYLANTVGNCVLCHTKVDLRTGKLAAPPFSGGAEHESSLDRSKKFVSPNLTPDPRWGWIAHWSEDVFVARMHAGRTRPGSPMPWHAFKQLEDDDARALYRYLMSLPPSPGGPDPQGVDSVVLTAAR